MSHFLAWALLGLVALIFISVQFAFHRWVTKKPDEEEAD